MHAALIDIGNVLLTVDFEGPLLRLMPDHPADAQARLRSLLEKKNELESGRMGDDEFIAWASQRLGFTGPPAEFCRAWNGIFGPIEPMWEVMRDLHARGIRLILFSNTNRLHAEHVMPAYDIFRLFDAAVFSYEVGAVKPDPAIYQFAIREHGLTPADTLYLDDLPENIATGTELGFETHQYDLRNHGAFLEWLHARL